MILGVKGLGDEPINVTVFLSEIVSDFFISFF